MGRRGPVPKPTNLRVLTSTIESKFKNIKEPRPIQDANPSPPELMQLQDGERRVWDYYERELVRLGLLTRMDLISFSTYCVILDKWLDAKRVVDATKGGVQPIYETYTDPDTREKKVLRENGKPVIKGFTTIPQLANFQKYTEMLMKMGAEFGFTPSSRARLVAEVERYGEIPTPDMAFNDDPFAFLTEQTNEQ